MERKIGEIFEYNGEWYQCLAAIDGCKECSFRTQDYCTRYSECFSSVRSDEISVIFKKLEKIGEPYTDYFQRYKCYQKPAISKETIIHWADDISVSIEIKQNKEDMEENNAKHSNSESIGRNLKPFDLEAAKKGKPVCTRDGRKARIICFDAKGDKPIIALVEAKGNKDALIEKVERYFINGHSVFEVRETNNDLMMLPEKKEGWVNVYKERIYSTKEEAIEATYDGATYIDTVKIEWEE